MNKLKRKLMASVCMLLVSAIMVTSTSFAWFTVSQHASAGDVKAQLVSTKNIEIAKARRTIDGTSETVYLPKEVTQNDVGEASKEGKDYIDIAEYYWGATVLFNLDSLGDLQLPATQVDSQIKGVQYSSDGRTKGLYPTTASFKDGITTYSYDPFPDNTKTESYNIAYGYGLYLRTNVQGNIVCDWTVPDQTGLTEAAKKAATVSFKAYKMADTTVTAGQWAGLANGSTEYTEEAITTNAEGKSQFAAAPNAIYYVDILVYFEGEDQYTGTGEDKTLLKKGLLAEDVAQALNATMENLTFTNDSFSAADWNNTLEFAAAESANAKPFVAGTSYKVGDLVKVTEGTTTKVWKCTTPYEATDGEEAKDWADVSSNWVEVVTPTSPVADYNAAKTYEVNSIVTKDGLTYKCTTAVKTASEWNEKSWSLTVPRTAPGWTGEAYCTTPADIALTNGVAKFYSNTKNYAVGDKLTGYDGGTLYCKTVIKASSTDTHAWDPSEWLLIPDAAYTPRAYALATTNKTSYAENAKLRLDDGTLVYAMQQIDLSGGTTESPVDQEAWTPAHWTLTAPGQAS